MGEQGAAGGKSKRWDKTSQTEVWLHHAKELTIASGLVQAESLPSLSQKRRYTREIGFTPQPALHFRLDIRKEARNVPPL